MKLKTRERKRKEGGQEGTQKRRVGGKKAERKKKGFLDIQNTNPKGNGVNL